MAEPAELRWIRAALILLLCLPEARPAASDTSRNYYETLSVEPAATDSQIKKAFRKLAVKFHPDKNRSAGAEEAFREIAEAYAVLSDKERRKLYDSLGHDRFLQDVASDPEDEQETSFHFSFSDSFHGFEDVVFTEESHFHWSFYEDGEDEEGLYDHFSFDGPEFNFYFREEGENGEVN